MTIRCRSLWLSLLLLLVAPVQAQYSYPIKNPFLASITGTPAEFQPAALPEPEQIDEREYRLAVHPERSLPGNMWAMQTLPFKLAWQRGPAPLIFIVAGTGGRFSEYKVEFLKRVYYQRGFHVVQLSSPSNYDFIASASSAFRPGISQLDARDLYRVMQLAVAKARAEQGIEVTDYYLTGYSLGALHSAFVSYLDETEQVFNFRRVVMLNPPVNLLSSVSRLDRMIWARVQGVENFDQLIEHFVTRLARYFRATGRIELNSNLLLDLQGSEQALTKEEMALLIGMAFRFSVADMTFTAEQLAPTGFLVNPEQTLSLDTSMTPFYKQALACNFQCYVQRVLLPFAREYRSTASIGDLNRHVSLYFLRDYLASSDKILMMTNVDDFILTGEDLDWLRATFGERALIYPDGGHCGSLDFRDNVATMLAFMMEQPLQSPSLEEDAP